MEPREDPPPLTHCLHIPDESPSPPPLDTPCETCGGSEGERVWCLSCGRVSCSEHAASHADHLRCSFETLTFHCGVCKRKLATHNGSLFPVYAILYESKYGEAAKFPSDIAVYQSCIEAMAFDMQSWLHDIPIAPDIHDVLPAEMQTVRAGSRFATGIVADEGMLVHFDPNEGNNHPERPERIHSITEAVMPCFPPLVWLMRRPKVLDPDLVEGTPLSSIFLRIPATPVTKEELSLVHEWSYIEATFALLSAGDSEEALDLFRSKHISNSVYINRGTHRASLLAAGGLLRLTQHVVQSKQVRNGLAVVRPPGHHAPEGCAMGFCIYNNVALAAQFAREKLGVERVLIVDWDVHHGNGIQDIFLTDPNVLYFSVHRYQRGMFYPGGKKGHPSTVGEGSGEGFSVNIGWDGTGMGDAEYMMAWHRVLLPIAFEFAPDLVLVSAGFDAARGDPLGQEAVSPEGYANLLHPLMGLAGGRVILALEGGYNLTSIANSARECARVLAGCEPPKMTPLDVQNAAISDIQAAVDIHCKYWKSLQSAQEDIQLHFHAASQESPSTVFWHSHPQRLLSRTSQSVEIEHDQPRPQPSGEKSAEEWNLETIVKSLLVTPTTPPKTTDFVRVCEAAGAVLQSEPNVTTVSAPAKVFGDLRGEHKELLNWFGTCGTPCDWAVDGDVWSTRYIFLGNFVGGFEGGEGKSLEVLCLLLALKVLFPKSVILLRGSHEYTPTAAQAFRRQLHDRYPESEGDAMCDAAVRVFQQLPLCCVVGGAVLCSHGGVGAARSLKQIESIKRQEPRTPSQERLFRDVICCCPSARLGRRVESIKRHGVDTSAFGTKAICAFLQANRLRCLVRSDQITTSSAGSIMADGRIVTLFSALDYQQQGNSSSLLVIGPTQDSSLLLQQWLTRPQVVGAGNTRQDHAAPCQERLEDVTPLEGEGGDSVVVIDQAMKLLRV